MSFRGAFDLYVTRMGSKIKIKNLDKPYKQSKVITIMVMGCFVGNKW